jgi:hypothetical protein
VRSRLSPRHRVNLRSRQKLFKALTSSKPTRISHREQPIIHILANKQIQNSSGTATYDHSPEKRRPTFPKERFHIWVFVGEDGPTDCADEHCDDNNYEDERHVKEVDVKV